jgi:hypothetical protein
MLSRYLSALLVALAVSPVFAATDRHDPAVRLVRQAVEAQGGEQALRSVHHAQWTLTGYRNEVEESERPEGPYVTEFDNTLELHDYQKTRYRTETEAKVFPVFAFTRGSMVIGEIPLRLAGGKKLVGQPEQVELARERMALSPERLLITALDAPDLQQEQDVVMQSVPQNVVTFTLDGAPVRIFLNIYTHLPTAVDYSGPLAHSGFWRFLGDVTARTTYSFWWLAKGGIHLPMQWNLESNGLPDQASFVRKLEIDEPLKEDELSVPPEFAAQSRQLSKTTSLEDLPLGSTIGPAVELGPGIILIPGTWNVTLVRQDDGVVILEAPISSGYSAKVIAEANRRFPGQPIKAVITTSDSWPHLAGIREYVAREIPIYALDLNQPILQRVMAAPHTSKPDTLQRSPRAPNFHLVSSKTTIGLGPNRLELYPLRGETTERQMLAYLPERKTLYGSDTFQRNPDGTYNLPQTVTELTDAVAREHLEVKQYFMMHISSSPWSDLQKVIDQAESHDSPSGVF